jgi:Eukaryotic translation initiation factor eIF2A
MRTLTRGVDACVVLVNSGSTPGIVCAPQAERGVADCLVPLKEGPVHDSAWSPDSACFAVVAGFMPAQTLIFDSK